MIEQKQKGFRAVRVRTIGGNLTSAQLRSLADLADQYGKGRVHITPRQSVEIHWVPQEKQDSMLQAIPDFDLLLAVRGARVLTTIACPGAALCKKGICDTDALTAQLNQLVVGREQPGKTKIAVSGCPNSCAKPQINDIGLHGVIIPSVSNGCVGCNDCVKVCKVNAISVQNNVPRIDFEKCVWCGLCVRSCSHQALIAEKQGYAVYIGGKIGRNPMLGRKIFEAIPEQQAAFIIEAILDAYRDVGQRGERLGEVIQRIGLDRFRQEMMKRVDSKMLVQETSQLNSIS